MYAEPQAPHHRPHFHAYYQDDVGVYAIDTIELIAGQLPRRQRLKYAELSWSIEEYHRGIKQLVGVERCFARKAVAQRNHIAVHSATVLCSTKFRLIQRFIRWYGRMGLILIQRPYMIGLSICLNLREWPSTGLLQRQPDNIVLSVP